MFNKRDKVIRKNEAERGITLIELLIVIIILGILSSFGIYILEKNIYTRLDSRCKQLYGPNAYLTRLDEDRICADQDGNFKVLPKY